MDFLLITNRRDLTTDYIVREMKSRGLQYHRLNTEEIASYSISFDLAGYSFRFQRGADGFGAEDVKAAYFRRPDQPIPLDQVVGPAEREYCVNEWLSLLKSLYLFLGKRWFSHPNAILLAEDKPRQLHLARKLGFRVPRTVITNDQEAVAAMLGGAGLLVGKPLKHALLQAEDDERVIFTTRLDASDLEAMAVAAAPVIYQCEIRKRLDIRATVVSGKVFAAGIHSQGSEETAVDWRRGSDPGLDHEIIRLPDDIGAACVALVKELDLRFGAIDLVLDDDGTFWFLECNPNGQWAWIENRTGLPIAAAIVDEMQAMAVR